MRKFLILFGMLIVTSCNSEVKKTENKSQALSHLQNFEVIPFFSPFMDLDRDALFKIIIESFQNLGRTNTAKTYWLSQPSILSTPLVLSLTEVGDEIRINLQVTENVEVIANKYKTACAIWKTELYSKKTTPQIELNGETANLIKQAIEAFEEDYRKANPGKSPVFTVQSPEPIAK